MPQAVATPSACLLLMSGFIWYLESCFLIPCYSNKPWTHPLTCVCPHLLALTPKIFWKYSICWKHYALLQRFLAFEDGESDVLFLIKRHWAYTLHDLTWLPLRVLRPPGCICLAPSLKGLKGSSISKCLFGSSFCAMHSFTVGNTIINNPFLAGNPVGMDTMLSRAWVT